LLGRGPLVPCAAAGDAGVTAIAAPSATATAHRVNARRAIGSRATAAAQWASAAVAIAIASNEAIATINSTFLDPLAPVIGSPPRCEAS
jgi:hypothetical protein